MSSRKISQKRINNSPVRTPSPDYYPIRLTPVDKIQDITQFLPFSSQKNINQTNQTTIFQYPTNNSFQQNYPNKTEQRDKNTIINPNTNNQQNNPNSYQSMYKKIQQIYQLITKQHELINNSYYLQFQKQIVKLNDYHQANKRLDVIKQSIKQFYINKNQQRKYYYLKPTDDSRIMPKNQIKNGELKPQNINFSQTNPTQNHYNPIKKSTSFSKFSNPKKQIPKTSSDQKIPTKYPSTETYNDSSQKFLKQKIECLQNELQKKINKIISIQNQSQYHLQNLQNHWNQKYLILAQQNHVFKSDNYQLQNNFHLLEKQYSILKSNNLYLQNQIYQLSLNQKKQDKYQNQLFYPYNSQKFNNKTKNSPLQNKNQYLEELDNIRIDKDAKEEYSFPNYEDTLRAGRFLSIHHGVSLQISSPNKQKFGNSLLFVNNSIKQIKKMIIECISHNHQLHHNDKSQSYEYKPFYQQKQLYNHNPLQQFQYTQYQKQSIPKQKNGKQKMANREQQKQLIQNQSQKKKGRRKTGIQKPKKRVQNSTKQNENNQSKQLTSSIYSSVIGQINDDLQDKSSIMSIQNY